MDTQLNCSILDDYDYDVTNIIRGVDHIANEVKQRLIWDKICDVEGNKTFPELTHAGLLFEGNKNFLKEVVTELPETIKISAAAMLNWLLNSDGHIQILHSISIQR
jgi:glutamyl-tRNA synthetase